MKRNRKHAKHLALSCFAMLMPLLASGHDFELDGIYYNITDENNLTVAVTYPGSEPSQYPDGYSGVVTIPSTVIHDNKTYSVTGIGRQAFYNCSSLASIAIPESVTSIERDAFLACISLAAVHINNIESWCNIDFSNPFSNPFSYSKKLYLNNELVTELTIPNTVTAIKDYAFNHCSSLTSIAIPESVTSIGDSAFSGCNNLVSVSIPESVISIGNDAFNNTTWYDSQPEGVVYINKVLYDYKGEMPEISIEIKEGTISISPNAFEGCAALLSITIPKSVISIGTDAFNGCSGLSSITIPSSVTVIEDRTFNGCRSLWNISIPESVTAIGNYAFHYCGPSSIILPQSIVSIGNSAFGFCRSLTSINIPEGVSTIKNQTFSQCDKLTSIVIPESVTSIEYYWCPIKLFCHPNN